MEALVKSMTTKLQRALARKHQKLIVGSDRVTSESTDSDFDLNSLEPTTPSEIHLVTKVKKSIPYTKPQKIEFP
jgi:hypothetical protein